MRGTDTSLFMMRGWAVRTAILAGAAALSACALDGAEPAGEPGANAQLGCEPGAIDADVAETPGGQPHRSCIPEAGAGASEASRASAASAAAASTLLDLNGSWTDFGSARPVISETNGTIVVDMSSQNRPAASGFVVNPSTIFVSFPDNASFLGTLQSPNLLRWSNGSVWEKVFTGTLVVNLNGPFTDGASFIPVSTPVAGFIEISLTGRPTAHGFAISATQIQVTFPDDATYSATLEAPGRIRWSNNSVWTALPIR